MPTPRAPAPGAPHREDVRALARAAGLRGPADLAEVDRRRTQLWSLSLLVAVAVPAAVLVLAASPGLGAALRQPAARGALAALLVAVGGYVAEREVALRRLTRLLLEERAVTTSLVDGAVAAIEQALAARDDADGPAAAARAQQELLTQVSHELRTPLTSIIGLVSVLASRGSELDGAQVVQLAETARGQGWRLARLVDDLLVAARADGGALAVRPAPHDVGALVRSAVDAARPGMPAHPVTVEAEPEVHRVVDPDVVRGVLGALLSNAAKYCPDGTPVRVVLHAAAGGLALEVVDDGPGVGPDALPSLAGRFTRGADPHHRGGLGLGLHAAQALAAAHGGRLEVERTAGGGSRFTVHLAADPVRLPAAG